MPLPGPHTRFPNEPEMMKEAVESIDALTLLIPEAYHDEFAELLRTVAGFDRRGRYDPDKHMVGRLGVNWWLREHNYYTD